MTEDMPLHLSFASVSYFNSDVQSTEVYGGVWRLGLCSFKRDALLPDDLTAGEKIRGRCSDDKSGEFAREMLMGNLGVTNVSNRTCGRQFHANGQERGNIHCWPIDTDRIVTSLAPDPSSWMFSSKLVLRS